MCCTPARLHVPSTLLVVSPCKGEQTDHPPRGDRCPNIAHQRHITIDDGNRSESASSDETGEDARSWGTGAPAPPTRLITSSAGATAAHGSTPPTCEQPANHATQVEHASCVSTPASTTHHHATGDTHRVTLDHLEHTPRNHTHPPPHATACVDRRVTRDAVKQSCNVGLGETNMWGMSEPR